MKVLLEWQEIQVAVLNGKALGAIELKPKRKFYDYKAKYLKSAKTDHIMPANISKNKYNEVLKIAERAHKILGCRGGRGLILNLLIINFIY